jgi:pimeloyl-ACP methyl ester carboxylesterase
MKPLYGQKAIFTIVLMLSALLLAPKISAQDRAKMEILEGTWMGRIEAGALYLRLVFNFSINEQDSLKASLESPDQGSVIVPMGTVHLRGDSIIINAQLLGGKYSGLIKGERSLEGTWEQMGQSFQLNMEKQDAPFRLNRPQEPKPPFTYRVEEVSIINEGGGFALSGTLTLPYGPGPFPAAVLISGSGPQNRDEELMGHKPFAVIADHLTRNGIAVLRYDDRGTGKSGGVFAGATSADLSTDAQAAFNFLQSRKEIDKNKTGLIGHSEGGLIAPLLASREPKVAWIVSLAGPGVNGRELMLRQAEEISRAMGNSEEDIQTAKKINEKLYKIVRKNPGSQEAEEKLVKTLRRELIKADVQDEIIEERITTVKINLLNDSYPWLRYFMVTEPSDLWKAVSCPVLILNGEKDLQVNAAINTEGIAKALSEGGSDSYRVIIFPGLNHLFQHCTTGLPGEYGTIEETFSSEGLEIISGWIRER